MEFSDRLEQESADSALMLAIEANAMNVVGARWDRKLDPALLGKNTSLSCCFNKT